MRIFISAILLTILFSYFQSCSVEKRVYRKGFYIHQKCYSGTEIKEIKTEEKTKRKKTDEEDGKKINHLPETGPAPVKNIFLNENDPSVEIIPAKTVVKDSKNENDLFHSGPQINLAQKTNIHFLAEYPVSDNTPVKEDPKYYSKLAKISFFLLLTFVFLILLIFLFSALSVPGGAWVLVYFITTLLIYLAGLVTSISATSHLDKSDPNRKFAIITLVFSLLVLVTIGVLLVLSLMFII